MIRIYAGFDRRESAGWNVFVRSLIEKTAQPFSITPLSGKQGDGTNSFTYERFSVPKVSPEVWALFLDGSDMLVRADLEELWNLRDIKKAVQVVKHDYKTKHPRKYIGTELEADNEDYPRKNWSSVVLWNCTHIAHLNRDPMRTDGKYLHRFEWLKDEEIGELPKEWNHLVGEQEYNPAAKIAHFTLGIPAFEYYKNCDYADEWCASV